MTDGTPDDIFYIVDTAIFAVEPMKLVIPSYSGPFTEYENRYGYGRVERTNKVRYYAYTEPQEAGEEGFAVGITRYQGTNQDTKTCEVYSLWFGGEYSVRGQNRTIADYISSKLWAYDVAYVNIVNMPRYIDEAVKMYEVSYQDKHEQARRLYIDARERKTSISEDIKCET